MTNYKSLSKDFMEMFASRFDVRGQTVPTGLKNEKGKEGERSQRIEMS